MSRFDLPHEAPTIGQPRGDRSLIGLNMKLPREQLPDGYCARLENKRLIRGAEDRKGTRTPMFANIGVDRTIKGSGVYSNPNGQELGLLAMITNGTYTTSKVIGIRSGTVPIIIPVTPNFASPTVEFAQHFDKVLAHQSDPNQATMIWDGLDRTTGFVPILGPSVDEPGIAAIPNPPWSINYLGRAWFPIPGSPDLIGASDVNDATTYDADLHTFRVNTGTADKIVGAYPYLGNNIIIGKERSMDILYNIPDDLGDSFLNSIAANLAPSSPGPPQVHSISETIGIAARKSGLLVGGQFMFLSSAGSGGIYQVTTDQHGNYIVDSNPVSDPIEPLIQRINWAYASGAVANIDGIYACWAVPLDDVTYNNAMLVLNTATGAWHGVDLWDNRIKINNLLRLDYYGTSRLFSVGSLSVRLHYEGTDDQLSVAVDGAETNTHPITSVFESRGYALDGVAEKSKEVSIALATLEPSLTIDLLVDGDDGAEQTLTPDPITRSRTKYDLLKPDFVVTNANGDVDEPKRQDYAILVDDQILLGDDGARLQRVWPWTFEQALDTEGRFISFRVTNSNGVSQVRSITFEGAITRTDKRA